MSSASDSTAPTASRFMVEVEAQIRAANRDAIAQRIPHLDRAQLDAFVRKTAGLRAAYLAAAFESDWTPESVEALELAEKRRLFEEALAAFEAVERAVRRGYLDIR